MQPGNHVACPSLVGESSFAFEGNDMRWFRLYGEFAYDPKIQTMSETFQRRYIMLLCLRCNDDLSKLTPEEIAFALRITPEELQETKEMFTKKRFINDSWDILNWDKRQYVSDISTERVRKHRQKQGETLLKRSKTVTETPPEQNRTEQNNTIPYQKIIEYLNNVSGKNFRCGSKETQRTIKARWNEGFMFDDFKKVIDIKCKKWLTDPSMVDYLRPQTLFGTKFESYLNEGIKKDTW